MFQSGDIFKFSKLYSNTKTQAIATKHGQCKDMNFVGKDFNDDIGYVRWQGDCMTCSLQIFDDADFRGDSKKLIRRNDCSITDIFCYLKGWEDRVSSLKLCCDKDPVIDYRYGQDRHKTCELKFREDKLIPIDAKYIESYPGAGRCDERNFVGKDFNDNIDKIFFENECADCTVQLFDDADFKGDSKTITIGSDECPFDDWKAKCDLGGWKDRVSSFKACCPSSMKV